MKRFRFRLEHVLRLRRRTEDRARQEFLDQRARVDAQKAKIDEIMRARLRTEEEARQAAGRAEIDLMQERACADYLERLGERLTEARQELELRIRELHQRREALLRAQRNVKLLEKLRERRLAEYRQTRKRVEQRLLDETGPRRLRAAPEA